MEHGKKKFPKSCERHKAILQLPQTAKQQEPTTNFKLQLGVLENGWVSASLGGSQYMSV
jgi:hypothetical protein